MANAPSVLKNVEKVLWPDDQVLADTAAVARRTPLTHCATNIVAANFTANALLAIGASPAMVANDAEAGEFAAIADTLLINLGTLSTESASAMNAAAAVAHKAGVPWVLDPVAAGVLAFRTALAGELLTHKPTVIRGNASEIMSLAGVEDSGGKGVDSRVDSTQAVEAARLLAQTHHTVVAVSGVVDYLTDGRMVLAVPGGDPLMPRVTAVGCVLGAMISAFLTVNPVPLRAAASASAMLAAAGERAARQVEGPGTFAVRLIDELYAMSQTAKGAA